MPWLMALCGYGCMSKRPSTFQKKKSIFSAMAKVANDLARLREQLAMVFNQARQGSLLQEGMRVVIAGKPNAGKSSLLNALSGRDSAIVTEIAGTTRDVLREQIQIDGMPLHIIDTAGLRESPDRVEQEGIRRAQLEIEQADRVLLVVDRNESDSTDPALIWPGFRDLNLDRNRITVIHNKIDLTGVKPGIHEIAGSREGRLICLSANTGEGLGLLRSHLKACMGFQGAGEGSFTARRRHIDALERAGQALAYGQHQLQTQGAGELLAEDLRSCQQALGEITGEFTSDALLGGNFQQFLYRKINNCPAAALHLSTPCPQGIHRLITDCV